MKNGVYRNKKREMRSHEEALLEVANIVPEYFKVFADHDDEMTPMIFFPDICAVGENEPLGIMLCVNVTDGYSNYEEDYKKAFQFCIEKTVLKFRAKRYALVIEVWTAPDLEVRPSKHRNRQEVLQIELHAGDGGSNLYYWPILHNEKRQLGEPHWFDGYTSRYNVYGHGW